MHAALLLYHLGPSRLPIFSKRSWHTTPLSIFLWENKTPRLAIDTLDFVVIVVKSWSIFQTYAWTFNHWNPKEIMKWGFENQRVFSWQLYRPSNQQLRIGFFENYNCCYFLVLFLIRCWTCGLLVPSINKGVRGVTLAHPVGGRRRIFCQPTWHL